MPGKEESSSGRTRNNRRRQERYGSRSDSRSGRDRRRDLRKRRSSSDRTDVAAHLDDDHGRAPVHAADDPFDETLFVEKVVRAPSRGGTRSQSARPNVQIGEVQSDSGSGSGSEGDIGPHLPPPQQHHHERNQDQDHNHVAPPTTREDYELARLKREESRERQRAQVQYDRKKERTRRREEMDELVPRADPGHERTVERRRALKSQSEVFNGGGGGTQSSDAGAAGGDDGAAVLSDALIFDDDEIKASLARVQAKRKERAELRAIRDLERDQERLGRLKVHRQQEEKNMAILQALAKQRFG